MKNISKIITMAIAIILSVSFFGSFHDHATAEACEEAPQSYDLTALDEWCGAGTERGSIRFIGAEVASRNGNTITLLDERGNQWEIENMTIDNNDFLLLWINDNDTDDIADDEIIKVWREAY